MSKKKKPSTYNRYKWSHGQLEKLCDFMHRDNRLVDILRLGDKTFRLTKLQDGSTNIELTEDRL